MWILLTSCSSNSTLSTAFSEWRNKICQIIFRRKKKKKKEINFSKKNRRSWWNLKLDENKIIKEISQFHEEIELWRDWCKQMLLKYKQTLCRKFELPYKVSNYFNFRLKLLEFWIIISSHWCMWISISAIPIKIYSNLNMHDTDSYKSKNFSNPSSIFPSPHP